MSKTMKSGRKPTHEEIVARAQRIYEADGRPQGRAMQHWLQAERELTAGQTAPEPAVANPPPKAAGPQKVRVPTSR